MIRKLAPEAGVVLLLLAVPLILFAPVAFGNRTILPADALYMFEPYRTAAPRFEVAYPQNHLVADLILQNYAWKRFLVEAVRARQLPLWDPYIFSGHPFLANGQHSALYPLSAVFYVLPPWRAFGVFIWLQLGLAGVFSYLFTRVMGARRLGGVLAGITFQLSGFLVVSVVHPMIIAGASWLPFILAMVELTFRQQPALGRRPATLPWALLGAVGIGCQMLVGHAENTYFVFLVIGAFVAWRLGRELIQGQARTLSDRARRLARPVVWLVAMGGLGIMLGAVQFVPLYEVVSQSFRGGEEAASLEQVLGWAYPWRRLITFGVPNFFGNPSHHGYFDLFSGEWEPALVFSDGQYIDWGIKNYVEGGAYLGLLPPLLALAAIAYWLAGEVRRFRRLRDAEAVSSGPFDEGHPARYAIPFFALLALFSLGCIFGTPLYALVYALPFIKQSHSPFRWVFPLTLSAATLAGLGATAIQTTPVPPSSEEGQKRLGQGDTAAPLFRRIVSGTRRIFLLNAPGSIGSLLGGVAFWFGLGSLAAIGLSRVLFNRIEPYVARAFQELALAPTAFADHRAFYSYEVRWIALFGLLAIATGLVLRATVSKRAHVGKGSVWPYAAIVVLVLDLYSFGAGVNPAVDPALLTYTPPAVEFLQRQPGTWRYATFTPAGTTKTLNANSGMFYDLQTVAGYDSLFSKQYADYMGLIEEQDERQYNRIASFRQWSSLDSPLTDLLNVKYIISEVEIPNPAKYRLVYEDEAVLVYENLAGMPRAFSMPTSATVADNDVAAALRSFDAHQYVIVKEAPDGTGGADPRPASAVEQAIAGYAINEVRVHASVTERSWLVLTDAFFPGWKATVRSLNGTQAEENEVIIHRTYGIFRGVVLSPGDWEVRFKYSPDSVKIGAFLSFMAGMALLFLTGVYLWRFFYREEDDADTVRRVAKNSLAPIVINLFTRGIEMAFAALMARILGPVGNGRYATAVSIYLWFDIIVNFGLDMYVMREVARDRACGRTVLANASALRLGLFAAGIPLLAVFLSGRQALGTPLAATTVWAVVLLYAGLLPGSIANGLAALFRACEKHEYPAAIQTVTTIIRVTLGVLVLTGGLGIVGLAAAAILTNLATLAILALLGRRLIWQHLPEQQEPIVWRLQKRMLGESWPLMSSLLLQALFPGLNVLLLQSLQGDAVVGWYDAARKWVDASNIIPSFFTFAAFPVMSRQADQDRSGLQRSYTLSIKLLTLIALPLALSVTLLATPLVGVLSGQQFLPAGATILRLLIWSILFGWINSLTNYVLIALHRQRYVLLASGTRVLFTVVANALLVPRFSYLGSAWILVSGECLLTILFSIDLSRQLGTAQWLPALRKPLLAGLAMSIFAWVLARVNPLLALVTALAIYLIAAIALRVLTAEEWELLAPLVPDRIRQRSANLLAMAPWPFGSRAQK